MSQGTGDTKAEKTACRSRRRRKKVKVDENGSRRILGMFPDFGWLMRYSRTHSRKAGKFSKDNRRIKQLVLTTQIPEIY